MQTQGIPHRRGAAFIWKWGAIAGVVLGVMHIPRDTQRADRKEARVSEGASPAPMLLSPPYGQLVETPLERDTPPGNEVPPGTTSCKNCRSVPIPWARRCQQDDTACS
jgi:hypothetical protein